MGLLTGRLSPALVARSTPASEMCNLFSLHHVISKVKDRPFEPGGSMRKFLLHPSIVLGVILSGAGLCAGGKRQVALPVPSVDAAIASAKTGQTAVLAGGCFWGIQAVFEHVKGVIQA